MNPLRRIDALYTRWLTAPEANAAGSAGLFRILFALVYLFQQEPPFKYSDLPLVPPPQWEPVYALRFIQTLPGALFFETLDALLIASLVLLAIGFRARLATLVVLVSGTILALFYYSFGKVSHDTYLTNFFVPLFMLFSNWGSAYSLDAALRRRRGLPVPDPHDSSWRYAWHTRALLLILSFLFFTAGYNKLIYGDWLRDLRLLNVLLPEAYISDLLRGFSQWSLVVPLYPHLPALAPLFHAAVLGFETVFPLALLNRRLRDLLLAGAVLMHAANVFFLNVEFSRMLPVYLAFVDWQTLYERTIRKWLPAVSFERIPTLALVAGALGSAALVTFVWNALPPLYFGFEAFFNGWLFWGVAALIGLYTLVQALVGLVRDLRAARRPSADADSTIPAETPV